MAETTDILSRQQYLSNEIKRLFDTKESTKQTLIDEEPVPRNVLLIGRHQSGKTTFANMIENPTKVTEELTLFKQLETVKLRKISNKTPALLVSLVDTVGFSDHQTMKEQLEQIQQQCKDLKITEIHLVCFCTSIETGIHQSDIDWIRAVMTFFGEGIKSNLCLIVTRCESKTKVQLERYLKQIKEDVHSKDVIHLIGRNIHFSGSLKYDDWNQGNDSLIRQFEKIYGYRENIFDLIKRNIEPFKLSTLSRESTRTPPTLLTPQPVSSADEIISIDDHPEIGGLHDWNDRNINNSIRDEIISSCRLWCLTKQLASNCYNSFKSKLQSCLSMCQTFWNTLYYCLYFKRRTFFLVGVLLVSFPMLYYYFRSNMVYNQENNYHHHVNIVKDCDEAVCNLADVIRRSSSACVPIKCPEASFILNATIMRWLEICYISNNSFE